MGQLILPGHLFRGEVEFLSGIGGWSGGDGSGIRSESYQTQLQSRFCLGKVGVLVINHYISVWGRKVMNISKSYEYLQESPLPRKQAYIIL